MYVLEEKKHIRNVEIEWNAFLRELCTGNKYRHTHVHIGIPLGDEAHLAKDTHTRPEEVANFYIFSYKIWIERARLTGVGSHLCERPATFRVLPLCQRLRKFRSQFKWKRPFRFLPTGIFGITSGGGPLISIGIFRSKFAVSFLTNRFFALIREFENDKNWQELFLLVGAV